MTALLAQLQKGLQSVPAGKRLDWLRGFSVGRSSEDQAEILSLLDIYGLMKEDLPPNQVVLLVHGIRTAGEWQERLRALLEDNGITAIPLGYEFVDVVRFLYWFRSGPVEKVTREIRIAVSEAGPAEVSILAHSFGTYIVSRILRDEPGLRFRRVLLCGSVVPTDFRWDRVPRLPSRDCIVNDVGTRDQYPVLAKFATYGYGPSGTFGFKSGHIHDRYHDFGHSDFFTNDYMAKYWVPFLSNGTVVRSPWDTSRPTAPYWMQFLSFIPLKALLILSLTGWLLWRFAVK